MPEAVIVSASRTPIGTAKKGTLRDTTEPTASIVDVILGGGMGSATVIEVPAP